MGTGRDGVCPWHLVTIHTAAAPDVVERVAGELRRRRCVVERFSFEHLRGEDGGNGSWGGRLSGLDDADGSNLLGAKGAWRDSRHSGARTEPWPDLEAVFGPDPAFGIDATPSGGFAFGPPPTARVTILVGARNIQHVAERLRRLPYVRDVTWTPAPMGGGNARRDGDG